MWFIHVLPLEIQLFRGEDCDIINWFMHVLPLEIQLFRGEDAPKRSEFVFQIDNAIDKIMMFLSTNILCYCQFSLIIPFIDPAIVLTMFMLSFIFSSPGHRPCELLSWVSVRRPSVSFSHLNLLL
jgi:hypothetical protein